MEEFIFSSAKKDSPVSSHLMSPSWIYLFRLEQEFVQTQSCTAAALLLSPVCSVCRILLLRDAIFINFHHFKMLLCTLILDSFYPREE